MKTLLIDTLETYDNSIANNPPSVYVLVTREGKKPAEFVFSFQKNAAPFDAKALAVYHQAGLRTIARESKRTRRERPRGAIGFAFKQACRALENKSVYV